MANDQQTIYNNQSENVGENNGPMEIVSAERSNDEMNDGEGMDQQNGTAPTDYLGLNALRNAISAIGDAMAELAETSAQRLRQYVSADAEKEQWHGQGGERVEENLSLTAASEVGMATNYEQSNGQEWVHQQHQLKEEEEAAKYNVATLSVNAPTEND